KRTMKFQPSVIGRQLGIWPSQPPNCTRTEPSGSFFAVMLFTVYALSLLGSKLPLALYRLMDQKPSTGTLAGTTSLWIVFPSFLDGVTFRYLASLSGFPPQAEALRIRR